MVKHSETDGDSRLALQEWLQRSGPAFEGLMVLVREAVNSAPIPRQTPSLDRKQRQFLTETRLSAKLDQPT